MATPDPRIAAYIAEIEQPGIPYVSRSHETLLGLYRAHGEVVVKQLVHDYFEAKRAERDRREPPAKT